MDGFLHPFNESDNLFPFDDPTIGGGGGADPSDYAFKDWQWVRKRKPKKKVEAKRVDPNIATAKALQAKAKEMEAAAQRYAEQLQREQIEAARVARNRRAIEAFLSMV